MSFVRMGGNLNSRPGRHLSHCIDTKCKFNITHQCDTDIRECFLQDYCDSVLINLLFDPISRQTAQLFCIQQNNCVVVGSVSNHSNCMFLCSCPVSNHSSCMFLYSFLVCLLQLKLVCFFLMFELVVMAILENV